MAGPLLVASYPTADAFLAAFDAEAREGGLLVRGGLMPGASAGDPCEVEVRVGGEAVARVEARLAAVARIGVAVTFENGAGPLDAAARRLRGGGEAAEVPEVAGSEAEPGETEEPVRGTVAERIAQLTVAQRIALAISGDREARIALLRDHNKALHAYVLRNPRIGLDEVQFAAKLNTVSPDALKVISEHKEWGQNPSIQIALTRNPKTPLPVALRLLQRLPTSEIRAIAKGGARDQLMIAARKILATTK